MDLQTTGRVIVLLGVALALAGGMLWLAGRLGMGSLPGNLRFGGQGWSCFVPIGLSILLSLLLTLILNVLWRFFAK